MTAVGIGRPRGVSETLSIDTEGVEFVVVAFTQGSFLKDYTQGSHGFVAARLREIAAEVEAMGSS